VNRLTTFQTSIARLFFGIGRSNGYLLGGGGALLAHGLTNRATQDLDFVGSSNTDSADAVAVHFARTAESHGIATQIIQTGDTFARLVVTDDAQLIIDIAVDVPPIFNPVTTDAGPTFAPEELAARKLTALFGRAEARDFADVFTLRCRFPKSLLIEHAKRLDLGFNESELATAIRSIRRFQPADFPIDHEDVEAMTHFFLAWAETLDQ